MKNDSPTQFLGNEIEPSQLSNLLKREKEQSFLLSISQDIIKCRDRNEFLDIVKLKLSALFEFKEVVISLLNDDGLTHSAFLHNLSESAQNHPDFDERSTQKYVIEDGIYNLILNSEEPLIFNLEEIRKQDWAPPYVDFFYKNGIRESIAIPLKENNRSIGAIFIYMEKNNDPASYPLHLVMGVALQISIAVSNIKAYAKIQRQLKEIEYYKSILEEENRYLQQRIKEEENNNSFIGQEGGLKNVCHLISTVACYDTTVLIYGETGTGKELIAREIHNHSPRSKKLMIKVNCAALPATLIESELFGHEKGSFTGATERRIGKFELANNGTLFLDEIGEMPLDLQVRLLRALQEKEIERIGGKQVIKTDVRIIAATNKNLTEEVNKGKFRSDLYHRLNVFPIEVPALRDRIEDINVLAPHFVNKFSARFGRKVGSIDPITLEKMKLYKWPGNVRELEHLIERSLLLETENVLKKVILPGQQEQHLLLALPEGEPKTLEESERDHIIKVLKRCGGKVKGTDGAAQLLGIPATTLHSKMKKHGIRKAHYTCEQKI